MKKIASGVYLETQNEMIENQKSWDDEDPAKEIDFTTSKFWLTTDNGEEPEGFDSEAEARDYIDEENFNEINN